MQNDQVKIKRAAYRAANRERLRAADAVWRSANPDKVRASREKGLAEHRARTKAWRAANKERLRASRAAYYAKNKSKELSAGKAYKTQNSEQVKKAAAAYKRRNRSRVLACNQKRRSLKRSVTRDAAAIQAWESAWRKSESVICHWCKGEFKGRDCHADHVIPLSKGGEHSVSNLAIACSACNLKKQNKLPHEFSEVA